MNSWNFRNPTALRLGMAGTLFERNYTVVGRGVLGMEEEGETYYWQEFYLQDANGEEATLVFEEGESGPEWRFFIMFEPEYAITAEDAATKRVGDPINLEGTDLHITLVDQSRVYFIEGQAPEGVEVGDVAHYFNAKGTDCFVVVSWTGQEVECFRGMDLSASGVAWAFKLPAESSWFDDISERFDSDVFGIPAGVVKAAAVVLVLLVVGIGLYGFLREPGDSFQKLKAPSMAPAKGAQVSFRGRTYTVQDHFRVDMATPRQRYEQHEYVLEGEDGASAILIYGYRPGEKRWTLFTLVTPEKVLAPVEAAIIKSGETLALDFHRVTVRDLFQARGAAPGLSGGQESPSFGFTAQEGDTPFFVRWDKSTLRCWMGAPIPQSELARRSNGR